MKDINDEEASAALRRFAIAIYLMSYAAGGYIIWTVCR